MAREKPGNGAEHVPGIAIFKNVAPIVRRVYTLPLAVPHADNIDLKIVSRRLG